jgi:hypothetical protein
MRVRSNEVTHYTTCGDESKQAITIVWGFLFQIASSFTNLPEFCLRLGMVFRYPEPEHVIFPLAASRKLETFGRLLV